MCFSSDEPHRPKTQCEYHRDNTQAVPGTFVPQCDADGQYQSRQVKCYSSTNRDGSLLLFFVFFLLIILFLIIYISVSRFHWTLLVRGQARSGKSRNQDFSWCSTCRLWQTRWDSPSLLHTAGVSHIQIQPMICESRLFLYETLMWKCCRHITETWATGNACEC